MSRSFFLRISIVACMWVWVCAEKGNPKMARWWRKETSSFIQFTGSILLCEYWTVNWTGRKRKSTMKEHWIVRKLTTCALCPQPRTDCESVDQLADRLVSRYKRHHIYGVCDASKCTYFTFKSYTYMYAHAHVHTCVEFCHRAIDSIQRFTFIFRNYYECWMEPFGCLTCHRYDTTHT